MSPSGPAVHPEKNHSTTLEEAWRRFGAYDLNAIVLQSSFHRTRTWIAALGVLATLLAVSYSVLEAGSPEPSDWRFYLRLLVIATPIAGSVLVGISKFDRSTSWVLLRGSAEAVKREIYRYRTRIGSYGTQIESRDERLAAKLESITGRMLNSEVTLGSLRPYEGQLPPRDAIAGDDDGFSELTAERYLEVRLRDQLAYYRGKSVKLDRQFHRLQWSIVALGGLGTFLAAVGFEIWIPVSVSLAAALGGYLELRRVESTLAVYTRAAMELENVATWWSALPPGEKSRDGRRVELVSKTEAALQTESTNWQQEIQDAIDELRKEESEPENPP